MTTAIGRTDRHGQGIPRIYASPDTVKQRLQQLVAWIVTEQRANVNSPILSF